MSTLDNAQTWHNMGISCIPIRRGSKKPALRWRPYIERLPRQDELRAWWPAGNGKEHGIAIIAGWANLAILDFDDSWQHSCWLAKLTPTLAKVALLTYRVRTARGVHIYVFSAEQVDSRSYQAEGLGYDIKGFGGYCLAPPSVHPSGASYTAIGKPTDTQHIDSIYELVPSALRVREAAEALRPTEPEDLWELATRMPAGASVEEIKQRFTIEGLLSMPSGNGRSQSVICPLHNDTTPSFVIYPDGYAHCYGACNFHGDVIDLFAALNKLSIPEAIRAMAAQL